LRKISDTISRLAALQARHAAHPADLGASDHLRTLADFGTNPGGLGAKLYIPNDLSKGAAVVVVVLHGCTQNAATIRTSVSTGFSLATPSVVRARRFRFAR
jgi:poly(3-hydroxybutyrate) depolymerase